MEINGVEIQEQDYIGDGVYVLFDGYGIWLHANNHEYPSDRIYIEPNVLEALNRFSTRVRRSHAERKDNKEMS